MAAQNTQQRQFRGVKSMRELAEAPAVSAFRARFEAGRSFDLDDDLEFCPGLLTEDDVCASPTRITPLHFSREWPLYPFLRKYKQRELVKQFIDICFAVAFHPFFRLRPLVDV